MKENENLSQEIKDKIELNLDYTISSLAGYKDNFDKIDQALLMYPVTSLEISLESFLFLEVLHFLNSFIPVEYQ